MAGLIRDAIIFTPIFTDILTNARFIDDNEFSNNETQVYDTVIFTPENKIVNIGTRLINDYTELNYFDSAVIITDTIIKREPY